MSASRQLPNTDVGIPAYAELSGAALMEISEVCDQLCTIKSKAPDSSAQKYGLTVLGHPSTDGSHPFLAVDVTPPARPAIRVVMPAI
jgi:hypothetical protein